VAVPFRIALELKLLASHHKDEIILRHDGCHSETEFLALPPKADRVVGCAFLVE
jgi:hypothetical protein